jgi:ubiquinone/menaquinone biosynthesis C-methylase UbiE
MSQFVFDEELLPTLEALYHTRDILRRRALVRDALQARPRERVLDLGCGPGFYVEELLEAVGREGAVVGVDSSPQMLAAAARRCDGHPNAAFHEGDATSLPADPASFDAVVCVQVLEYVPDTAGALAEIARVLRPGGRAVVWDVDWATLSVHSSDAELTDRVLRAWDGHLTHSSLPRTLAPLLRGAGFEDVRAEGHAFTTIDLSPETYGGANVALIERFVAGQGGIGVEEAKRWADDQRRLGERGEFYFACIQFCFTATRA